MSPKNYTFCLLLCVPLCLGCSKGRNVDDINTFYPPITVPHEPQKACMVLDVLSENDFCALKNYYELRQYNHYLEKLENVTCQCFTHEDEEKLQYFLKQLSLGTIILGEDRLQGFNEDYPVINDCEMSFITKRNFLTITMIFSLLIDKIRLHVTNKNEDAIIQTLEDVLRIIRRIPVYDPTSFHCKRVAISAIIEAMCAVDYDWLTLNQNNNLQHSRNALIQEFSNCILDYIRSERTHLLTYLSSGRIEEKDIYDEIITAIMVLDSYLFEWDDKTTTIDISLNDIERFINSTQNDTIRHLRLIYKIPLYKKKLVYYQTCVLVQDVSSEPEMPVSDPDFGEKSR